MITLGTKVRDPISGFSGTAVARCEYVWNCIQIAVAPNDLDKEGKLRDSIWFDESRLEAETPEQIAKTQTTGGPAMPCDYPPQR